MAKEAVVFKTKVEYPHVAFLSNVSDNWMKFPDHITVVVLPESSRGTWLKVKMGANGLTIMYQADWAKSIESGKSTNGMPTILSEGH